MAQAFIHDSDARRDPKLVALRLSLGKEAIADWWSLVEFLRDMPGCRLDSEWPHIWAVLGHEIQTEPDKAQSFVGVLIGFGLLQSDGRYFWSQRLCDQIARWELALSQRKERAKKAADARYGKQCSSSADAVLKQDTSAGNGCVGGVSEPVLNKNSGLVDVLKQCSSSAQAVRMQCSSSGSPITTTTHNYNNNNITETNNQNGKGQNGTPPVPEPATKPPSDILTKYLGTALQWLEEPGDQPWTREALFVATSRRPMVNYPDIHMTGPELAEAFRQIEASGLPKEAIRDVFQAVDGKIKTAKVKHVPLHTISAFNWVTGWALKETCEKFQQAARTKRAQGEGFRR
jgi:hypothetical protein